MSDHDIDNPILTSTPEDPEIPEVPENPEASETLAEGEVMLEAPSTNPLDDLEAAAAALAHVGDGAGEEASGEAEGADPLNGKLLRGPVTLWEPSAPAPTPARDVSEQLEREGVITESQADTARQKVKDSPGMKLVDQLLDMGVDEVKIGEAVAVLAYTPFERVKPDGVNELWVHRLGVDYCRNHGVLPLREEGGRLVIGVTGPLKLFLLEEVRRKLNHNLKAVIVIAGDIELGLAAFVTEEDDGVSQAQNAGEAVSDIIKDIEEDDVEVVESSDDDDNLEQQAAESPVIRFVNYLIYDAAKSGASDIHIEPQEKILRVRYRIDGILHAKMQPPKSMHAAIVSRLKIMANLDISERRLPQDGRIRAVVHGRQLDLRVSTLPTGFGEKCVLRILDARSAQISLDELGMPEDTLTLWQHQIQQPHGIILVTGPTGSGKTTTLYSSLNTMDRDKLNISTVEDPIEYHLEGLSQVNVVERIGMTFAAALKSLLRQDPDVVMVGEIRDEETARIAIQAALTGHLVLSTLHTNDAPSSITRLINIGVEPFLIGASINAVLAQRLVRRNCPECKAPAELDEDSLELLTMHGVRASEIYHGTGCGKCHDTGYSGRVGLYEQLVIDDQLRDAIAARPNVAEFRRLCVERGMITLRMAGFRAVGAGQTTVEEVLRVTQSTI
jgi:type IV pilus assembly protein PilB